MPIIDEIINEGFLLHQEGRLNEAENIYQEAISINAENANVCNLMAVLKLQQNDAELAVEWAEKAISIKSEADFYETLFQAYIRAGHYNKIVDKEATIIKDYPKNFSLFFNIALAYKKMNMNEQAIKYYNAALKIDPSSYKAWFNLAHIYSIEGQCKNAVSALQICNKLKPNDKETQYFLSIALMRCKNYAKGLKLFENRLCREMAITLQNKTYPNLCGFDKLWKGENIKNKTLYVYYEAGYGDVIMFSRYLPLLKKKCKKVVFYPQKQLVPLFEQNPLGVDEIIEGYIPEKNMDFDVHAPLMSLPYLLGLKGNDVFETPEGYMNVNEDLANTYKEKYFNTDKIKIGIKWQGNTYFDTDRVISVDAFRPLLELNNIQYYSFQTFEGSEKLQELTEEYNIVDIGKDLLDFGQTAAALSNVDLVICNDTSLAHLAGAMGKPCYVLLPYETNWRWHENLSHCDWYDSVKLFRQTGAGDWNGVVARVIQNINSVLKEYNNNQP